MAWAEFRKTVNGVDKRLNEKTGQWEVGNWYAIGRDPKTGDRLSEPAGLKSNLKRALAVIEQIEIGNTQRSESVTLETAYQEYEILMKKTRKAGTWSAYNWGLEKLLEFLSPSRNVDGVDKKDMLKFRARIMQAHSVNGMLDIIKIARTFFSYCVECGYIQINPAQGLSKGIAEIDVAVYLTDAQIRHLLASIQEIPSKDRKKNHEESREEWTDIVKTTLLTGMREGDIAKFRIDMIDNDKIYILGKGRGAGKHRVIPINSKLKPILEKYTSKPGRIFVFEGWNVKRIKSRWNRLFRRAKKTMTSMPPRVRFHDLRHTFASNYLKGGGTLADLKLILGHANIKTTIRYAHFQPDDLGPKMERLRSDFLDAVPTQFHVA